MNERTAAASTVATLFEARAREHPKRVAVQDDQVSWTYGELRERSRQLAAVFASRGVETGDRVALLSENRAEVLAVILAAAHCGAIVACQNWRLAAPELRHGVELVEPRIGIASPRHATALREASTAAVIEFGPELETAMASAETAAAAEIDAEAGLLIMYTSGTTGQPKGAVLSHRAEIVRNLVVRAEYDLHPSDTYVAWSPMYHMGGTEYSIGTLISGGTVIVVDGFDAERLADIVDTTELGWLLLMPGMVGQFADVLEDRAITPVGVRVCGVMADLVPPRDLARVTRLLDAPYANTFGATETGNPPASAGLIEVGTAPESLPKQQSIFCEVRLVNPDGDDVADGEPGELWMRGPTLFSGYWNAPEANAEAFADGWFHMGDVFVRRADGRLEFVDRVKYMIKSGGENIYPAEIERVLLGHRAVAEAAVVRKPDPRWGEVPVAFVALRDGEEATPDQLAAVCEDQLARYKIPRDVRFLDVDDFPRSASGKVQRHELEKKL